MPTVAVGDIHGNRLALDDLLVQLRNELKPQDTLVFLGDYIDRGPDSRGCVERILQLKLEANFPVVTLLGNHELWMLRSQHDPTCHSWIIGMEAFDTIASYSAEGESVLRSAIEEAGTGLFTGKVPLPYQVFFDSLPSSHLKFFQQLQLFHRTPDVVCVHGGIDLEGQLTSHDPEFYAWGPDRFPEEYHGTDQVVYGHRNNAVVDENGWPQPLKVNRTYGIDTIATGVLTAMRFPEGKILQSKRYAFSSRSG